MGNRSASEPEAGAGRRVSRRERIVLFIHRGLDKRLSPLGVWAMRRTKGGLAGRWKVQVVLLTTRGRRSGKERTVVLQYFPDGEAMVVVAANDGGEAYPGWYFNLQADPEARAEVSGRTMRVRAEELGPAESLAWWERMVELSPSYERYRRATDRPFPVVRLVPVAEGR
jgi:deazaflavin-dependent oxidoreductase (nitroreductase family)